jgi:hypothetical protein
MPAYRRITLHAKGIRARDRQSRLMMPTHRRTREQDRERRIDAERALNAARVAERNKPPPF